jgi:AraC-like DNA-binding protein
MKPKLESSAAWLKKKYITESKSLKQIAFEAGCSVQTIRRRLKEAGLVR